MTIHPAEDDTSSLERAREGLYSAHASEHSRAPLAEASERSLPHAWGAEEPLPPPPIDKRHVRTASIFLGTAVLFFLMALGVAGYFLYYGSNSVSTDKVTVDLQGPTTIAGGDTVPLSLTIINKNPVALDNATIEIDFPDGTRGADNVLKAYPRYTENLGLIASGATVTRSVKAVIFGGAGQTLTFPISLSYGTANSNAVFVKNTSYAIAVSSTPLSVSVDALSETTSGAPITFTLTVRSNATIPLDNIVLADTLPFGFLVASSSAPLNGNSFYIGTLAPGATKQVTLTGVLSGQDGEQRVFHFTVGTVKSAKDQTLAVTYMTQDASVTIAAPFITTSLALNNNSASAGTVLAPASPQAVALSYANTLSTTVTNVVVTVAVNGTGIDYNSIKTSSGFYNSTNHTIIFSSDTDPALASLAPGASGIGNFSFTTLGAGVASPSVTFTTSVSGVRVGQSNVPEQVTSSTVTIARVATAVALSAYSSHTSGLPSSGPIPPRPNEATTYSIIWNIRNGGSPVAGGTVRATLPGYVTYTGVTSGGGLAYDSVTHAVTWGTGDLAQGASAQAIFQVSITPSTSQSGSAPVLVNPAAFFGYDRYAGVTVTAGANPSTTETPSDPGYNAMNAVVQ